MCDSETYAYFFLKGIAYNQYIRFSESLLPHFELIMDNAMYKLLSTSIITSYKFSY